MTNRSGRSGELTVSVDQLSAGAASLVDRRTIRVTVSSVRQVVAYQVTDAYGGRAGAFIVVPPRAQLYGPQLRSGVGPIPLDAGRSVDVRIGDYVVVGGASQDAVTIAADPAPRDDPGHRGAHLGDHADPVRAVRRRWLGRRLRADRGRHRIAGRAQHPGAHRAAAGAAAPAGFRRAGRSRPAPPPRWTSTRSPPPSTTGRRRRSATASGPDRVRGGRPGAGQHGDRHRGRGRPRGTRIDLPIEVTDGDGKDGNATLTVTVTGSTKPLPTVVDQQVGQGRGGRRGGGRHAHRQSRPGRPRADRHGRPGRRRRRGRRRRADGRRAAPCGSPRPPGSSARSWSPPTSSTGRRTPTVRSRRPCGCRSRTARPPRACRPPCPARSPPAACSCSGHPPTPTAPRCRPTR